MTSSIPSATLIRDLYARMLLTRIVDDCAWRLHEQGYIAFFASSRGHEAAQVGSAVCIEVGKDFTLPYYRDLGVVLTIGMTPYEVFRTYLHPYHPESDNKDSGAQPHQTMLHWGYHKHNTVTGPAPVATQILHAAGIAFSCKLRKADVVTIAYSGDKATFEPDFLAGVRFAALHQLPVVFICEQDCTQTSANIFSVPSSTQAITLPAGLAYQRIDGADVVAVYTAMCAAMQHAHKGQGPILLEMCVTRSASGLPLSEESNPPETTQSNDPLLRCQHYLQEQGHWSDEWASQLYIRLSTEVEQALQDAQHG